MEETKRRHVLLWTIQTTSKLKKVQKEILNVATKFEETHFKFVKQHTTAKVDNKQVPTISFKVIATLRLHK